MRGSSISKLALDQVAYDCRVLPPSSPFFALSDVSYPPSCEPGLLAPGMHAELTVSFTPHSLADYDDGFLLETEHGVEVVPLCARRPPPVLSLPQHIDVGNAILGNMQVRRAWCR